MNKNFWKDLAAKGPIVALAPMDGYTDGPYRLTVRKTAPETVVFSEFYSADGLVRSKHLAKEVLPHDEIERQLDAYRRLCEHEENAGAQRAHVANATD